VEFYDIDSLNEKQSEKLKLLLDSLGEDRTIVKLSLIDTPNSAVGVIDIKKFRKKNLSSSRVTISAPLALRFLVARAFEVEDAAVMLREFCEWYDVEQPFNAVQLTRSLPGVVDRKEINWWPHRDRFGRPVVIAIGCRHFPNLDDWDAKVQHMYWGLETAHLLCGDGGQIFCICDAAELGFRNLEIEFLQHAIRTYMANYPERLGKCVVVNAAYIFHQGWRMVSGWLDDRTRSKIEVVDDNGYSVIRRYMEDMYIPKRYGGSCEDGILDVPKGEEETDTSWFSSFW